MIDSDGFRANVGIIIANGAGQVFWGQRIQQDDSWQFPQGGIDHGESPKDAMYRELFEEVGLQETDVNLIAESRSWLRYRIPANLVRKKQSVPCIGQKQKWFLLQLQCETDAFRFDCGEKEEFCGWRWVSYWYPVGQVVNFKREVYRKAMTEFAPLHIKMTREPNLAE